MAKLLLESLVVLVYRAASQVLCRRYDSFLRDVSDIELDEIASKCHSESHTLR